MFSLVPRRFHEYYLKYVGISERAGVLGEDGRKNEAVLKCLAENDRKVQSLDRNVNNRRFEDLYFFSLTF